MRTLSVVIHECITDDSEEWLFTERCESESCVYCYDCVENDDVWFCDSLWGENLSWCPTIVKLEVLFLHYSSFECHV